MAWMVYDCLELEGLYNFDSHILITQFGPSFHFSPFPIQLFLVCARCNNGAREYQLSLLRLGLHETQGQSMH